MNENVNATNASNATHGNNSNTTAAGGQSLLGNAYQWSAMGGVILILAAGGLFGFAVHRKRWCGAGPPRSRRSRDGDEEETEHISEYEMTNAADENHSKQYQ